MDDLSHMVNAARLFCGDWSEEHNDFVDEGDIAASYSAHMIARMGRIHTPFVFDGRLWVCLTFGTLDDSQLCAWSYTLMPAEQFGGKPINHTHIFQNAAAASDDPLGSYHGVLVRYRGRSFVLVGPPARFVASDDDEFDDSAEHQLDLFAG